MQILVAIGGLAIVFGILGFIVFFMQKYKGGRIANTPFHKTGEVASKGDEVAGDKGALSTEGKVVFNEDDLLEAPVQGGKALYYKLTVQASWKSGDNSKTVTVHEEKKGVVFGLDDGSGVCQVDPQKGGDFDPLDKFSKTKSRGLISTIKGGGLEFGENGFQVHPGGRVKGHIIPESAKYEVKEEVLRPQPQLYVNGKYADGVIGSPSWASLYVSGKSRDETLADTMALANKTKMVGIIGSAGGAVMLIIGLIFGGGDKPADTKTADTKPAVEAKADAKPAAGKADAKPAAKSDAKPAAGSGGAKAGGAPKAGGAAKTGGGAAGGGAKTGGAPKAGAGKGGKRGGKAKRR